MSTDPLDEPGWITNRRTKRTVYIYTEFLWVPQSILFSLVHCLQTSKRCCTFPRLLDDYRVVTLQVCLNFFACWHSIFLNVKATVSFEFSPINVGCKHSPDLKLLEGDRRDAWYRLLNINCGYCWWRTLSHRLCKEGGQAQSLVRLPLL